MIVSFFSGLTLGIVGSLHCIGMCGPLALSLPIHHQSTQQKSFAIANYNLGRTISYTLLGLFFGLIGMSFSFFHLQQVLSIIAGIVLILMVYGIHFGHIRLPFIARSTQFIQQKLSKLLASKSSSLGFFQIGIANGLLPCGLVYAALIAGVATASVISSGVLMLGFGLATIPVMASIMIFGRFISVGMRQKLNAVTPYLLLSIGVILILRGMNLGIPFISPHISDGKAPMCH